MAPAEHVLYSFRRCPYAMRARLAIAAAGMTCELREVALRNKPAAMIAASAKATVPVLVLADGSVIDESLAIMVWVLECNDPQRWLTPEDDTPAQMNERIARCDGPFKHALDHYKYPSRHVRESPESDARERRALHAEYALRFRGDCIGFIDELEQRLTNRRWLGGSAVSLSDAAIMPFVRQFAGVEAQWFAAQPWPRVHQWLATMQALPLFDRVMTRYPVWQDGAPPVRFPDCQKNGPK